MKNKCIKLTVSLLFLLLNFCFSQEKIVASEIEPIPTIQEIVEQYITDYSNLNCLSKPCSLFMYVNDARVDSVFISIQQLHYFYTFGKRPPEFFFKQSGCFVLVKTHGINITRFFRYSNAVKDTVYLIQGVQNEVPVDSEATLRDFLIQGQRITTVNRFGCR